MEITEISSFLDLFTYADSLLPFGELIIITTFIVAFINFRQRNSLLESFKYSLFLSTIVSFITLAMQISTAPLTIAFVILTAISLSLKND